MNALELHQLLTWVQTTVVPLPALACGISSIHELHAKGYAAVMYSGNYNELQPANIQLPSTLPAELPGGSALGLPPLTDCGIQSLKGVLHPMHLIQLLASALPHKVLDSSAFPNVTSPLPPEPPTKSNHTHSDVGGAVSPGVSSTSASNSNKHDGHDDAHGRDGTETKGCIATLDGHAPLLPVLCRLAASRSTASFADPSVSGDDSFDGQRDEQILLVYLCGCKRLGLRCTFSATDLLDGTRLTAVIDNLRELHAIAKARMAMLRGVECEVQYDYSRLLVHSVMSAEDVAAEFHTPALTYFEHLALYTGRLSPLLVNPAGRSRLWAYLLNYEDEFVAHPGVTAAAGKFALRRISEAQKRCAMTDDVDEHLNLLYSHVSGSAGLMLVRRKLIRALARAGLPPQFRGYLWSRFAGLVKPGLSPLRLISDTLTAEDRVHADSRLCPAIPTSVWEKRNAGVVHSQSSHASTRAYPLHPTASPAVMPSSSAGAALGEIPALDLQDSFSPSANLSRKLSQLTYYDFLVVINGDALQEAGEFPPYLEPLLEELRAEVAAWRASKPTAAVIVESPHKQRSAARAPNRVAALQRPDHLQPDSDFKMVWHGRVLAPANLDTVIQVTKDLPRTFPHLQPMEPSRVVIPNDEDAAKGAANYYVQHIYAARRHTVQGDEDTYIGGVVPTVSQALAPLSRTARDLHFQTHADAEDADSASPSRTSSLHIGPTADPALHDEPPLKRSLRVSKGALRRILLAFSSHSPVLDFVQGLPFLVSHALRWLGEADAFALFSALLHSIVPADYYTDTTAGVVRDQRVLEELIATCNELSPLLDHLAQLSKGPRSTVLGLIQSATLQWFICLFTVPFSPAFSDRVWDALICEGDAVVFRATLAVLRCAMPKLMAATEFHVVMEILKNCHLITFSQARFTALFDCWVWPLPHQQRLITAMSTSMRLCGGAVDTQDAGFAPAKLSPSGKSDGRADSGGASEKHAKIQQPSRARASSTSATAANARGYRMSDTAVVSVASTATSVAAMNTNEAIAVACKRYPSTDALSHGMQLLLLTHPEFATIAQSAGFHLPAWVLHSVYAGVHNRKMPRLTSMRKLSSVRTDTHTSSRHTLKNNKLPAVRSYGFGISALAGERSSSSASRESMDLTESVHGPMKTPEAKARDAALEAVDDTQVAQYGEGTLSAGPVDARQLVLPDAQAGPDTAANTSMSSQTALADDVIHEDDEAAEDEDVDDGVLGMDDGSDDEDIPGVTPASTPTHTVHGPTLSGMSNTSNNGSVQPSKPSQGGGIAAANLWLRAHIPALALFFYNIASSNLRGLVWREAMHCSSSLIASRRAFYIENGKLDAKTRSETGKRARKGVLPEYVLGVHVSGMPDPDEEGVEGEAVGLDDDGEVYSDDGWEVSQAANSTHSAERPAKRMSFAINMRPQVSKHSVKSHTRHRSRAWERLHQSSRLLALYYRDTSTGAASNSKGGAGSGIVYDNYFPIIGAHGSAHPTSSSEATSAGEGSATSRSVSGSRDASDTTASAMLSDFLRKDGEFWSAPLETITPAKKSGVCMPRKLHSSSNFLQGELLGAAVIADYFPCPADVDTDAYEKIDIM